ncbi:hypothetical protein MGN70_012052 [Eutypa lata]|nr:hypothetical protein MGN70_012052 [Eutypa lata]
MPELGNSPKMTSPIIIKNNHETFYVDSGTGGGPSSGVQRKNKKKNRSFAELHWDTGRAVDMLHAAETGHTSESSITALEIATIVAASLLLSLVEVAEMAVAVAAVATAATAATTATTAMTTTGRL